MAEYNWPEAGKRSLIGGRIRRVDGPAKVSGNARYTYDVNLSGMLYGKILRSPHAHAKIKSIDTSEAESLPGVKAVRVIQEAGTEIKWAGDEVVGVAALSEEIAEDALRRIKVEYEVLPHVVNEEDLSKAGDRARPAQEQRKGEPEQAFQDADAVSEGYYGQAVITHCCLEPHGQIVGWDDDENLTVWASTQAVSRIGGQLGEALEIPVPNIRVYCQNMGGGFGSKFGIDRWGVECARLAKMAGAPVKMMLDRDSELMVAGGRPSLFANVKVSASKDGTITGWESESWGTGGVGGAGVPPLPYVLTGIPHQKRKHTFISTNIGGSRAWRAPNHPQACLVTMGAMDDLAAKLNMDPLDLALKNVDLAGERGNVYREEFSKGAELMDWRKKWRPRGQKRAGHRAYGMGLGMHTWGGRSHNSTCNFAIHPDGSVEVSLGSQDLGTGTRTIIAIAAAETFGLSVEDIRVNLGDNRFPASGASGGSTTVGGVSSATRRGAQDALEQLLARTAPALGTTPDQLEIGGGRIQVKGDSSKSLSWKQACGRLGVNSITTTGKNPGEGSLNSSGVGGIQMAEVSVDTETGVVRMEKFVAVQDCGLILNMKTAESQVYGAVIMGITYSLYEEKVMDDATGQMLNPNMEFYRLAGIGDIGEIVVHMMTGPGYDERGIIGLGEPPVISPGAAIANAVANAVGVRVPTLPLTPDKVLAAMEKGGVA